jgi:hypothetical protein
MQDHNWAQPFNDDVAAAKSRHQQAVQDAHRDFEQARAKADQERNADYLAASDAWDAIKSSPNDPAYAEARDAYERSKAPTSLAFARRQLAAAIERTDLQYKADLVRIGAEHNVSIGIQPR